MTEHPSLLFPKKEQVPEAVVVTENFEALKQKVAELQKSQNERRQTINEMTEVVGQLSQTDQELNALEKEALELLIQKLKRL